MSHAEFIVTAEKKDISVTIEELKSVEIETLQVPGFIVVASGNIGPRGPAGKWEALTQTEYDLLNPPDPDTLYIIIQ